MKRRFVLPFLLIIAFAACNKDKFKTEPQVEAKSISPETVFHGDAIYYTAKYTDDEGDIDSVLVGYQWYNGNTAIVIDTFRYDFQFLGVPKGTRQADITIGLEYNTLNNPDLKPLSGVPKDTTASFTFVLKDKAGHRSNAAESKKIRLKKP